MPETQYYTKHYQSKTTASETSLPQNTKKKKKKKKNQISLSHLEKANGKLSICVAKECSQKGVRWKLHEMFIIREEAV